ncbi:MAG: AAA family ATPase [SAR202 cluster bacterium]|nr:AAA family ATPase [SAR202 cluster bacterium]
MQHVVDKDLAALVEILPPHIREPLGRRTDLNELLEIVMDFGRPPEARFRQEVANLSSQEVQQSDIEYVTQRVGAFGGDNRAGIARTLHRISAIRNRGRDIVGLTLRAGRAVYGTIRIIEDLVLPGKSTLLLGRPGVGKTTMLREVARVLADSGGRRVVIVDTSNEIAGDGDIPHPGIGRARRMQVDDPSRQHAVMIEAVENHMPEVVIIDEIGTELEANAARTIAERGVQLVATAHGNTLENLLRNPTLSDLVGGIQSVTLGDVEARRRGTQKTVLERRAPPTFDVLVEIQSWNKVAVHPDVADVVDRMLRGLPVSPEIRTVDDRNNVHRSLSAPVPSTMTSTGTNGGAQHRPYDRRAHTQPAPAANGPAPAAVQASMQPEPAPSKVTRILPYGVNKGKLQQVVRAAGAPVEVVDSMADADVMLTVKNYYRRRTTALRDAEQRGKPVYVLRRNTVAQIDQFVRALARQPGQGRATDSTAMAAVEEAEEAIARISQGDNHQVNLAPQGAYVRHLQHELAEKHGMASSSIGREPKRFVVIYRR